MKLELKCSYAETTAAKVNVLEVLKCLVNVSSPLLQSTCVQRRFLKPLEAAAPAAPDETAPRQNELWCRFSSLATKPENIKEERNTAQE